MTDLTKELNRSQGIPFLEYKHFVTRTFFPKVRRKCVSRAPHCSQICPYQVRALLKGFLQCRKIIPLLCIYLSHISALIIIRSGAAPLRVSYKIGLDRT